MRAFRRGHPFAYLVVCALVGLVLGLAAAQSTMLRPWVFFTFAAWAFLIAHGIWRSTRQPLPDLPHFPRLALSFAQANQELAALVPGMIALSVIFAALGVISF